jgi:uncharacterized membrane protein
MQPNTQVRVATFYCHLAYGLHGLAVVFLVRSMMLVADHLMSRSSHAIGTESVEGMFVAAAIMLCCLLTGYAIRLIFRSSGTQLPDWICDHLKSQGKTFWISFVLCIPLAFLMGGALLLIAIVLTYRLVVGWSALFQNKSI